MKVGFDLDGTLDIPSILELARTLLMNEVEVHVITGVFKEASGWQDVGAKHRKLSRLDLPYYEYTIGASPSPGVAMLHILEAAGQEFDREYRLADLGLRKGALCEVLGLTLFFDDSKLFCQMIPKMSGGTTVLKVN
jgi:hypothetical protein